MAGPIRVVRQEAGMAQRTTAPFVERFGRVGFAAKGVVYMLIGGIALKAATGSGSATDSRGAMRTLVDEPLGQVLLAAIAAGLLCYALWRGYCALADPEDDSAWKRVRNAGIAAVHAGIALEAARLALSGFAGSGGGSNQARHWSARLLEQPFGAWLLGAVGVGFGVYGLYQIYRGISSRLDKLLRLDGIAADQRRIVRNVARAGLAARGVVFALVGLFLVDAARDYDASQARDLGGAMRELNQQPYGPWLLGIVAVGLFAYGIYELVRARYRIIRG
ncbi:MAG: DUF1206 domain-containing protein [Longimicrobiales bacterium]